MYYIIKYTENHQTKYAFAKDGELEHKIEELKNKGFNECQIRRNQMSVNEFLERQANGMFASSIALDTYFASSTVVLD